MHLQPIHGDVRQKPTQHCKAIILQFKKIHILRIEGGDMYIQLIHSIVQQKLEQYCEAIILQLKNN